MKYSDAVSDLLHQRGYTHCFFVAGGNSMHLLDSARQRFICVPFVHEVSATIAAEYFNEVSESEKSFVLLTAGPGLTNATTAIAGAFLESRELLVIGGQVKSTDLVTPGLRQRGIQEVDGVGIVSPITKLAIRITEPVALSEIAEALDQSARDRPGPVFIEVCLDVQATHGDWSHTATTKAQGAGPRRSLSQPIAEQDEYVDAVIDLIDTSERPVLLIGGGLPYGKRQVLEDFLKSLKMPTMTTWNAADRLGSDHPLYFGRPNTWGQRYSNVLIQQADLVLAVGTRLGLQQTGFNWQRFAPLAKIVHVDIDKAELEKGHPNTALRIQGDAATFLSRLLKMAPIERPEWLSFCTEVRAHLPLSEPCNTTSAGYVNPYEFVSSLSDELNRDDIVIPCSSGGAFTTMMQAFSQRLGQRVVTNKGLASMGYGLAGAIGAAIASPERRVVLVEGDGGFSQNLQELATVGTRNLNLKAFIFSNEGYASIRMTQLNYFHGEYLGCDTKTGLGFPNWGILAQAFGISFIELDETLFENATAFGALHSNEPVLFVVPIDPFQTYFPKISSQVDETGSMRSNALHRMSPDLPHEIERIVLPYLP